MADLWRVTFEVDGYAGCPKDLLQDLEEDELWEAITTTEKYLSINLCGGPPPPSASAAGASSASGGCASSASAAGASSAAGGCASSASAAGASAVSAGSHAFPEGNVKAIEIVKKRNDAELAATTFEKITVDKEVFRCYLQAFDTNRPWATQKNPWVELSRDTHNISLADDCGLAISPFVDPEGEKFQI
jgi:hypothetical protein